MFSVFAAIPPFLMNHLEKKAFLRVGIFQTSSLLSMSTQGCTRPPRSKRNSQKLVCHVASAVQSSLLYVASEP